MSQGEKIIIKKDNKRSTQAIRLEKTLKQMPILISNIDADAPKITKPSS